MIPLFVVAAGILVAGQKKKSSVRARSARAKSPVARTAGARVRPRTIGRETGSKPAYARKGNGKIRQEWTSFPWQAERVTQVAHELLIKGEKDPVKLTTAVAKTLYPVHPITGMGFKWPPKSDAHERDVGAEMIWERIRLRVNTLVAADEEAQADAATVHAPPPDDEADPQDESGEGGDVEEESEDADADADADADEDADADTGDGEEVEESDEEDEPVSPRIGRATIPPMVEAPPQPVRRRQLTLSRKRVMQRRVHVDPHGLHPEDNHLGDGLFHTVQDRETIHDIAVGVLRAAGLDPTVAQLATYVSLIVCSPANDLPTTWDDEHELPGAQAYPWGADRPTIWLPKLNEAKAQQGIITTLGVTWPDGSNGITPPPEMVPRGYA
jgi:hypothetical protein